MSKPRRTPPTDTNTGRLWTRLHPDEESAVRAMAKAERRELSNMLAVLVTEALAARSRHAN
jgi:hypothetical protein